MALSRPNTRNAANQSSDWPQHNQGEVFDRIATFFNFLRDGWQKYYSSFMNDVPLWASLSSRRRVQSQLSHAQGSVPFSSRQFLPQMGVLHFHQLEELLPVRPFFQ